ncbi:MAG: DUF3604 domain-containing protein [Candidatus Binatia bacterium]
MLATLAPAIADADPPPWERTETRAACGDFTTLRTPFFGDLHIHTAVSADSYIYGTRVDPRDAYAFAIGATIPLADDDELQTRSATIDRPLDFAAVTDHSEWFGEVDLCTTPSSPAYDDPVCQLLRAVDDPNDRFLTIVQWQFVAGIPEPPPHLPLCDAAGVDCEAAAISVWQDLQDAAEGAYDRSGACSFTTFVGFEHTQSPSGAHQHRNVIFRNHVVPPFAVNTMDTIAGGSPQGVWSAIEDDCLDAGQGCDAVIIPHNTNLSNGQSWTDPIDAADARRRQDIEPLAEIFQVKAGSECRFDRLAGVGSMSADELCTFEQRPEASQIPNQPIPSIGEYPPRNLVRNALKDGLMFEEWLGVNPFKLGFIASTDNHNGTAGNTEEIDWEGSEGNADASPMRRVEDRLRTNPGGLAVVWAEENSRDAIFSALRRRETYATSGTRPVLRFFGGRLRGVSCDSADMVARAYERGTPMGGQLGPVRGNRSPKFVVSALKDPGPAIRPGTDLQRIQIIKGWVDASGQTHEKVFDVAGDPNNGAGVNPNTCAPTGTGAAELCTVWEDPDFDPEMRSFYYARVLENPTCRWSTLVCKDSGVDPFAADCDDQAAAVGPGFENCCLTEAEDPFHERVIQERAWSSPIWYRPDDVARLRASVSFGSPPGTDTLTLRAQMGRLPSGFHPDTEALTVTLRDDDAIYEVTIPAGTLQRNGSAQTYLLRDSTGAVGGLRKVRLKILAGGKAVLKLRTVAMDLSNADRSDHFVELRLETGLYSATQPRMWHVRGNTLRHVS